MMITAYGDAENYNSAIPLVPTIFDETIGLYYFEG